MPTAYDRVLHVVAELDRWYFKWLADDATDEHKVDVHRYLMEHMPDAASDAEKERIVERCLLEYYDVDKLNHLPRPRLREAGREIPLDEIEIPPEAFYELFPEYDEDG